MLSEVQVILNIVRLPFVGHFKDCVDSAAISSLRSGHVFMSTEKSRPCERAGRLLLFMLAILLVCQLCSAV